MPSRMECASWRYRAVLTTATSPDAPDAPDAPDSALVAVGRGAGGGTDAHGQRRAPLTVRIVQRRGHRAGGRDEADLAHPLDPVGRARLGDLDEEDLDRRHVLRTEDPERPQGRFGRVAPLVRGEVLGQ